MNESPGKMSEDDFTLALMTEDPLMSEYTEFLQNFLDGENADQQMLKEIQTLTLENDLESSFRENITENVEKYEKQLQIIKDKSDNLTFQLIAKKEAHKIDAAEKESLIELFYAAEREKATKDLQKSNEIWDKIEQDLKNQNVLAIAKKKLRLNELRNNLEKQISEKNVVISQANEETKHLRMLLDEMRAQYIQLQNEQKFGPKNEMRFDTVSSVQTTPNGNHLEEVKTSLEKIAYYEIPRNRIITKPQCSGKLGNTSVHELPMLKLNPCSVLSKQDIVPDKFSLAPVIVSYSEQNNLNKAVKTDETTIIEMATNQKNLSDNKFGRSRKLPKIYRAKNLKLK